MTFSKFSHRPIGRRAGLICGVALALAGCSNATKTERYQIDPPPAATSLTNRVGTAVLRDVSLPEYASDQEIAYQTSEGAVRSDPKHLWADNPQRAMTLALARQISTVSGAQVIAEPWPLSDSPARQIEVRVTRVLATSDANLELSGTYYVSPMAGQGGNLVRSFDIKVPLADTAPGAVPTPGVIAQAQSAAVVALARQIAQLQ